METKSSSEWLRPEEIYVYYRERAPDPVSADVLAWAIQQIPEAFETKMISVPDQEEQIPVVAKASIDRFITNSRQGESEDFEDSEISESLSIPEAYNYYCSKAEKPIGRADFWRLVDQGEIESRNAQVSQDAVDEYFSLRASGSKNESS